MFTDVIGSELDGTRVEKGDVIKFVLSKIEGYDPNKIVMVGDRKFDVVGAQDNGIAVIGVSYGYGSADELVEAKPNYIVNTVRELRRFLCE